MGFQKQVDVKYAFRVHSWWRQH